MENEIVILQKLFRTEAGEELEKIKGILFDLEDNPGEVETIHKLFRSVHNLKGSAGLIGLMELKEALHQAENMLDAIRKGRAGLDQDKIQDLAGFMDAVGDFIETGAERGRSNYEDKESSKSYFSGWMELFKEYGPGPASSDRENIEAALILDETEKAEIAQWQENGKFVYSLELHFTEKTELQGASALIFWKFIRDYGEIFKTAPALEELRKYNFPAFKIALLVEKPFTPEFEKKIISYPLYDVKSIKIRQWVLRPGESRSRAKLEHWYENTIRVDAWKIDRLTHRMDEFLKIEDGLAKLYREDLPDRSGWEQVGREIQHLNQAVRTLRAEIIQLRLIPAHQLFFRIPKMVRDLAGEKGKMVELIFWGEATEIDKQVADKITDSITHLIRNAVDHGIECIIEREAAGKPQHGKIGLGVTQKPDQVILIVKDDGRGLDLQKIKARAEKNGLLEPGRELTDAEIIQLIFLPGFSTSEQVSDLSGRGVGLDVVANSVRELKGSIEVETKPGEGTEFRLIIPSQNA